MVKPLSGHHRDFARPCHTGVHKHPQHSQQAYLPEELTPAIPCDNLFRASGVDGYLHLTRNDDVEVVACVTLAIQRIAHRCGAARPKPVDGSNIFFGQNRERDRVVGHRSHRYSRFNGKR